MRRVSYVIVTKQVLAIAVGLSVAVIAGASKASAGEFILENNSNEVVHVAVGHVLPDGRNRDEGWYIIAPARAGWSTGVRMTGSRSTCRWVQNVAR